MVDGITKVTDHEMTESNRSAIKSFVENILILGYLEKLNDYINHEHYTEHNPYLSDNLVGLRSILATSKSDDSISTEYIKCHRILAEGNFVLAVCEGYANNAPSSFFDLYRLEAGHIVEHWDTTEAIPPRHEWKNNNGKF